VEQALADLQARCETVFVGGLSMGAVLALYLAARHPELSGVVAYSPALWPANWLIYLTPVFKYLLPRQRQSSEKDLTSPEADLRLWSYEVNPIFAAHELLKLARRVRKTLPQVTQPLLVIHSTLDSAIHPDSARRTYERVASADKELVTLHNSGHCITVDSEWEFVAQKTHEFIQTHQ
jgi:carboxylesterase